MAGALLERSPGVTAMTAERSADAVAELFRLGRDGDDSALLARVAAAPSLAAARDEAGISLPLFCLYHGRDALAQALADARPDLDVFEAAALGRDERLADLLTVDPSGVRAWSPDGFTPLHLAAFFGRAGAARRLLEHGADPSVVARNPMAVQPLHSAAAGRHVALVAILLRAGAAPNARQHGGWAPLHAAAANGDRATLLPLLDAGADPAAANDAGRRAADLAREGGHHEVADELDLRARSGP